MCDPTPDQIETPQNFPASPKITAVSCCGTASGTQAGIGGAAFCFVRGGGGHHPSKNSGKRRKSTIATVMFHSCEWNITLWLWRTVNARPRALERPGWRRSLQVAPGARTSPRRESPSRATGPWTVACASPRRTPVSTAARRAAQRSPSRGVCPRRRARTRPCRRRGGPKQRDALDERRIESFHATVRVCKSSTARHWCARAFPKASRSSNRARAPRAQSTGWRAKTRARVRPLPTHGREHVG